MESGDTSDEEASPCDPKSNNQMQKAISMLVDMETKDGLKRHAIMVIAKKTGLACADLLYYKTKNIRFLLCTSMVLIYNSELGIIISSEFFSCKETLEEALFTPYYLNSIFLRGVVGEVLRQFIFIFICRLRL